MVFVREVDGPSFKDQSKNVHGNIDFLMFTSVLYHFHDHSTPINHCL